MEKLVFRPMQITLGVGYVGYQAFYAFQKQVFGINI
jgi:hypothetical protein